MLLWIGFALLTVLVIAALARPLLSGGADAAPTRAADMAVYRDQLEAIDAERDQGLLDAGEAEAARTELARRLLRAAEVPSNEASNDKVAVASHWTQSARMAVFASAALIPLSSIGIYLLVGSPEMPGKPYAERIAHGKSDKSLTELVTMVEARLKANPNDGKGWDVIGPVYLSMQRFQDATKAYANSIRINGETPERVARFAEAIVMANNGQIVPDARKAYQRLLVLAPDEPEPKFWLALAKEQDGDLDGAIKDLEAMLQGAPADAPWRKLVETRLSELRTARSGGGAPVAAAPQGGASGSPGSAQSPAPQQPAPLQQAQAPAAGLGPSPSAAGAAAVQQMSPQDQQAFIQQMVDGLAARLEKDGKDVEGWKRLVRAYKVMGRDADAAGAVAKARGALSGDQAALDALNALAKELGIGT